MENNNRLEVQTALGKIIIEKIPDTENPGLAICFEESDGLEYQCGLIEATNNEEMRLLVWSDSTIDDYTHAFKFTNAGNPWTLTDDDCYQYVREVADKKFELIQMVDCSDFFNDDEETEFTTPCRVYFDSIDINALINDDEEKDGLRRVLKAYDYQTLEELAEMYGDRQYQIMAECIFENEVFENEKLFEGTEQECIQFIQNYVKQ